MQQSLFNMSATKTENYGAQVNLKSLVAILQMHMPNIIQPTCGPKPI
uniref:Uncharacterized protein n=1 Tax=Setaria italica TaxID=4555 RepID=K4A3I8_SETIT